MDENPETLSALVGVLNAMHIPYMVGGSVALVCGLAHAPPMT